MHIFIINLIQANDRRQHIQNEFTKRHLDFEFFNAITPADNINIADTLQINISNANLADTEISCLLSHISLWQYAVDNDLAYLAIFEDDIYLGKEAEYYLHNSAWLDSFTFDVLKLEAFLEKTHLTHQSHISQSIRKNNINRQIYRLRSNHMGAAGYILSLQGAKHALNYVRQMSASELVAVDHILFEKILKKHLVYQLCPAICIQSMFYNKVSFHSQLADSRQNFCYEKMNKDSLWCKITSLLKRINRGIGKRTYYKIVDFK